LKKAGRGFEKSERRLWKKQEEALKKKKREEAVEKVFGKTHIKKNLEKK